MKKKMIATNASTTSISNYKVITNKKCKYIKLIKDNIILVKFIFSLLWTIDTYSSIMVRHGYTTTEADEI